MLLAWCYGLWAGRDLYQATLDMTWGRGFWCRRTASFNLLVQAKDRAPFLIWVPRGYVHTFLGCLTCQSAVKKGDHSSQYLESEMTQSETCINTIYSNKPLKHVKQWNRDLFTNENKVGLTSSERGTRLSQKSHDTTSLVSDIWSNSSTLNRNGGSSAMNQGHSNDSVINEREREREREREIESNKLLSAFIWLNTSVGDHKTDFMPVRASLQSRVASFQREYCTMMTFISIIIRYTSLRKHTMIYLKGQDMHASNQKWIMCIKYKHYWKLHTLTTAFLDNCLVNSQRQLVQSDGKAKWTLQIFLQKII